MTAIHGLGTIRRVAAVAGIFGCGFVAACGGGAEPPAEGTANAPVAAPPAADPAAAPAAPANPHAAEMDALRASIPGGQMILADDPAFDSATGFGALAFNGGEWFADRWTEGGKSRVDWLGPDAPGLYKISVFTWRDAYPTEEIEVRYKFTGDEDWRVAKLMPGAHLLEGEVDVVTSAQKLSFEVESPTWIPAEILPGSNDPRSLGLLVSHIEVRPVPSDSADAPAGE